MHSPDVSAELLAIETTDFSLSIKGPLPSAGAFALRAWAANGVSAAREATPSSHVVENIVLRTPYQGRSIAQPLLRVECASARLRSHEVEVRVGTAQTIVAQIADGSNAETEDERHYLPLFFENVEYQVLLSITSERHISLGADAPSLLRSLTAFESRGIVAGTLNFGGNVGQSRLIIEESGKPLLIISFVVFSAKVDFGRDRLAMTDELSALHRVLLLRLLRPTAAIGASAKGKATGLEWLVNLAEQADDVEATLRRIAQRAHHQLSVVEEIRSPRKLRRPGRALARRIATQGKDAVLSRRSLPIERRCVQVGTPENRYLKFLARRLVTTGHKWLVIARKRYERDGENDAGAQLDRISAVLGRIGRALKSDFWNEVGQESPVLLNHTTFNFQEPFVRFEKRCKAIGRALTLDEAGERLLSTVSMEQLYELWTYCKLAEITAHLLDGAGENPLLKNIKVEAFAVTLQFGKKAAISIGDDITLSAQRRFKTYENRGASRYFSPLVPQEPDLVFEMRSRDVLHILDAKYRLLATATPPDGRPIMLNSAGLAAHDLSGAPVRVSPREDDINVMHRYRDAIRVLNESEEDETDESEFSEFIATRPAAGYGVILYPHRPTPEETEATLNALKQLRRFGIGAVPLCPGAPDEDWPSALGDEPIVPDGAGVEQVRALARIVSAMLAI